MRLYGSLNWLKMESNKKELNAPRRGGACSHPGDRKGRPYTKRKFLYNDELKGIIKDLKSLVEAERAGGIEEILLKPSPRETGLAGAGGQPQPVSKPVPEKSRREQDKISPATENRQFQAAGLSNRAKLLDELRKKVLQCEGCGLCKTRHNVVFGEGSPESKILFIGEAPGGDEDMQGRPFIGRAGKVLDRVIQSVGFKREDLYIANILKCRPPGNRNPLPEEVGKCLPFLLAQIEIIKPKIVCALGRISAQTLLNTTIPISALRGKFHPWRGMKMMPTFHPAYILRNPKSENISRMDLEKIKEILVTTNKKQFTDHSP